MIQRIIVDDQGRIYPVTSMFDIYGRETNDTLKAEAFVISLCGGFRSLSVEDAYIYTVH